MNPDQYQPDWMPLPLSGREQEVLQAMTRGLSNAEIAEQLHLSVETVKSHVKAILQKLQARDRTQAVLIALVAGLVLLPSLPLGSPLDDRIESVDLAQLQRPQQRRHA